MSDWFCIKTNRYKENWVARQLAEWCDEVYLPLLREYKKVRRQLKWVIEPLFPCYLFARFGHEQVFGKVRSTPGVGTVLSTYEEGPIIVDGAIIDGLRARSINGHIEIRPAVLSPGDELEVIQGPFEGLTALFEQNLQAGERIVILLDLLSSRVRVQVPRAYVQKKRTASSRELRA
jgi:transcriptional antiterminator RfaH